MKCVKCKERESTGVLIAMCDPCFDEFEAQVNEKAATSSDDIWHMTDSEADDLNTALRGKESN